MVSNFGNKLIKESIDKRGVNDRCKKGGVNDRCPISR